MRISGWAIDGFGVFRDYEVSGIPPGLSVFLGPNEAGKTTLLAFIRQILFGFPDERSRERRYPPSSGRPYGGRLFVAAPDGDYVVERSGGPRARAIVTLPDGRRGSEEELQRLLGGADRRLFQTIFAFSLAELQDFATLDAEGVHDRIFSAGIVGAGNSARDALRALADRQSVLLRPRGSARINGLLARLDDVDRRLVDAHRLVGGYAAVVADERAQAAEVQRLAAAVEEQRAFQAHGRRLVELWPLWVRRRAAAEELARLEVVEAVPDRGEARLAELVPGIEAADRQLGAIERHLGDLEGRVAALRPDERLAAMADEIGQLHEALTLYRERIVRLPEAAARRRQALRALSDHLRDLGPDWDRPRLAAFDRSIPAREEVRAFADARGKAGAAAERAAGEAERAESERAGFDVQRAAVAAELAALPEPDAAAEAALEGREGAVRRLRVNRAEHAAISARIEAGEESLLQLEVLRGEAEQSTAPPSRRAVVVLGTLAVALVGAAVAVAALGMTVAGAGLGVGALVAAGSGVWLWRGSGRVRRVAAAVRARFSDEYDRAAAGLEALYVAQAHLRGTIEDDAALLGLHGVPSTADLESRAAEVAHARQAQHDRAVKTRALEVAERRLAETSAAGAAARDAAERASRHLAEREAAWEAWRQEHGVPGDLTPQGVLDFFDVVRLGREALRVLEAVEQDFRGLGQFVLGYEERVNRLLRDLGEPGDLRGLDLIAVVDRLHERIGQDRDLRRDRAGLEETAARLRLERDQARAARDALVRQREALFAAAGAADAEGFHRRLAIFARRSELEAVVRDGDRELLARVGDGPAARDALEDLGTGDVDRWQRTAEEAAREVVALGAERDRAVAARRDAETARRQIEESATIPELALERAGIVGALEDAARGWQVAALAEALVHDTLGRFERERQPAVLAQASRLFADVTGGRYSGLLQQEGGLSVVDQQGGVRSPESLSRGTAEQLYLCIRLGLATEFARRGGVLPLVMDDVLVNFDPERAAAVAQALAGFAEHHQVLLFTCHPETAHVLRAAAPSCGLYGMERHRGEVHTLSASA